MRIAIESPEVLSDSDLEEVINVWQRRARRISFTFISYTTLI
jgi:hypothetical protein